MRNIMIVGLGVAALGLAGCEEMKAGFDKGYAEGKAKAEAEKKKKEEAKAAEAAPATAETPEKAAPTT